MVIPRLPKHSESNFLSKGQSNINGLVVVGSLVQHLKVAWCEKLEPQTDGEFVDGVLVEVPQGDLSVQCQVDLIIELICGI